MGRKAKGHKHAASSQAKDRRDYQILAAKTRSKSSAHASFNTQLARIGLQLRAITGDGNCLFRSISDQREGDQTGHMHYRSLACKEIIEHADDFVPFIDIDNPTKDAVSLYANKMSKLGVWGGNLELVALSRAMKTHIVVHQYNAPRLVIEYHGDPSSTALHLAFHDHGHYSSIRRIDDSTVGEKPKPISIPLSAPSNNTNASNGSNGNDGDGVSGVERMIMDRTDCTDIERIRSLLSELENDSESVVEALKVDLEAERTANDAKRGDESKSADIAVTEENHKVKESAPSPSSNTIHESKESPSLTTSGSSILSVDESKSDASSDGESEQQPASDKPKGKQSKRASRLSKRRQKQSKKLEKEARKHAKRLVSASTVDVNHDNSSSGTMTDEQVAAMVDDFGSVKI